LSPRDVVQIAMPLKVEPLTVQAGGWITLDVRYTKLRDYDALVGVMIANEGTVVLLPASLSAMPSGTHQIKLMIQVPSALPPGEYVAYVIGEHTARLPLPMFGQSPLIVPSEPFTVVP
jgi:hypothetical protein